MNNDWRHNYLSVDKMREIQAKAGPNKEEARFLSIILERAAREASDGENSFTYIFYSNDTKDSLCIKICSWLTNLGYTANFFSGFDEDGDPTKSITIAW